MAQILLIGDSLIADHDWQLRMPGYQVTNSGVPGMVATDLLGSLPAIKKKAGYADVILVMIGTNDLLSGNYDFIATIKELIVQIHKLYPTAELVFNSLLPVEIPTLPYKMVESLNVQIEALTMQTGSCFLNAHSRFVDSDRQLFQADGVHLTDAAYEIWCRSLLEYIAFLVEDD